MECCIVVYVLMEMGFLNKVEKMKKENLANYVLRSF